MCRERADAPAIPPGEHSQLGSLVSTAWLKQDIEPDGAASRGVMAPGPVTFRYREDPTGERKDGLIAEEVAPVYLSW